MKPITLTMSLLSTLAVCVICLAPARTARAEDYRNLEQSIATEIETVAKLVESIDATLKASEGHKMSQDGIKAHSEAKELWKQAKELYQDGKYVEAYRSVRQAKKAIMPAATEVFVRGVDKKTRDAVALQVQCAAARVGAIADLLRDKSVAEASQHYQQARKLYQDGKALYERGEHREAFRKLEAALIELDAAIRAFYQAYPSRR